MRILAIVNAIFAAAFLLVGIVALFGLGITGALILVPGVVFAVLAAAAQSKSRMAVLLAVAADGILANFALKKLLAAFGPASAVGRLQSGEQVLIQAKVFDYVVPSLVLLLVVGAVVGLLLDWRAIRAAAWW